MRGREGAVDLGESGGGGAQGGTERGEPVCGRDVTDERIKKEL